MNNKDFHALDKALLACKGIEIEPKFRRKAEVAHAKFEQELKIKQFLNEKRHHENYKDIRNDV